LKTELQLSLFNQFESLVDLENNNKLNILSLLSSHLDFSSLIPYEVMSSYHSSVGRNPYPLISMIKAFFVKNLYGYESIEKLIDLLAASPKVRNFCGFSTIPNKSTFSRFKSTFYSLLEDIFNNLVNITEPICRKMGENFASHLIYDTSGIIPYVKENNDKFFNRHLKNIKKANKGKSIEDIHKIAYGTMPKQSSVDEDIKFFYVNGGFHYAHKFGLFTNAFGIARHIAFVDKEFIEKNPLSHTNSPEEDKTLGDSTLLEPMLNNFYRVMNPKFKFHTFLADSALDKYEHYPMLMKQFNFNRVLIPINRRNSKVSTDTEFPINEIGTPVCSKYNLPFKNGGISREKNRSTRIKYHCPKTKTTNRKRVCFCETPCSPSTYGRVTYTYPDQNLRFYPGIARDTEHFKKVYKRRTIIERTNHLFKNVMGIGKTLQRNGDSFKSDLFLCGITQLTLLILADKLNNLSAFRSIPKLSKTA
jgi:hypothetical protein